MALPRSLAVSQLSASPPVFGPPVFVLHSCTTSTTTPITLSPVTPRHSSSRYSSHHQLHSGVLLSPHPSQTLSVSCCRHHSSRMSSELARRTIMIHVCHPLPSSTNSNPRRLACPARKLKQPSDWGDEVIKALADFSASLSPILHTHFDHYDVYCCSSYSPSQLPQKPPSAETMSCTKTGSVKTLNRYIGTSTTPPLPLPLFYHTEANANQQLPRAWQEPAAAWPPRAGTIACWPRRDRRSRSWTSRPRRRRGRRKVVWRWRYSGHNQRSSCTSRGRGW